jgi:hypothetical protein
MHISLQMTLKLGLETKYHFGFSGFCIEEWRINLLQTKYPFRGISGFEMVTELAG